MDQQLKHALIVSKADHVAWRHSLDNPKASKWRISVVASANEAFAALRQVGDVISALVVDDELVLAERDRLFSHARELHPKLACMALRQHPSAPVMSWPIVLPLVAPNNTTPDAFENLLERTYMLEQVIGRKEVRGVCGELTALPHLPSTYWRLSEAAIDPNISIAALASIVEADPAISAKVLQLANSAFFRLSRRTGSIAQALTMLGVDTLRGLVLSAHLFGGVRAVPCPSFSLEHFQDYSLKVARASRRFARRQVADDAFTAGLLHDIGQLVLAMRVPEQFEQVLVRAASGVEVQSDIEREIIGITHAEAGAYLLAAWGLPITILECVAFHDSPESFLADDCELLALTHAAQALTGIVTCGEPDARLSTGIVSRAGLTDSLGNWRKLVEEDLATA